MHTPTIFEDFLLILLVAVPAAMICLRLRLPHIVGFIFAGIAIGPYGLGLIRELAGIEILSEIGVMLLLFTIGLEFSLTRLREMKRLVLLGGALQVGLTTAVTATIFKAFGIDIGKAVFFGFLAALSSTAIVLKMWIERNEIESPHGRAGVAILLFQDIAVVFMLLAIPFLSGVGSASLLASAQKLIFAVLALGLAVAASYFFLPKLLYYIVKLRSPELFLLVIVLFLVGMSWLTSFFGLSFALGGFIAGVVLAETEYNHQVFAEVMPFRDVFNGLFFVSIGLLVSVSAFFSNAGSVLALILAIVVFKALIIWLVIRFLGLAQRIAVIAGLGMAQIGEFSFVLARAGQSSGLINETEYQVFLSASIGTMLLSPFLISAAPAIGFRLQSFLRDGAFGDIGNVEDESIHLTSSGGLSQHVIIVGYGLNGRNLARVLRVVGIPYVVLDLNADIVRRAKNNGEKINFADATRREVLLHAGIRDAWVLVLAMSDAAAARRTVKQARQLNPELHIIVRTRYVAEITELLDLGANEVIPEEFETSIEIFSRVLLRFGVSRSIIESQVERIRRQGYEMLRMTAPMVSKTLLEISPTIASTETLRIGNESPALGKALGELDLRGKTGATVIAIIRDGKTEVSPGAETRICEGDTLVILGSADDIERASELLLPTERGSDGFNP
ncbi:MAG TPA: cation:proton antiporter [Pyrinomonadaceae bacterium]|jgi:CPA2 family monovalent cation:H+ antiporter-2|nr:cation:proton antiporter [Pyrinomonadaceae bacterium]